MPDEMDYTYDDFEKATEQSRRQIMASRAAEAAGRTNTSVSLSSKKQVSTENDEVKYRTLISDLNGN